MAATSTTEGKPYIGKALDKIMKDHKIETVLDIGIGQGTYSDLFRSKIGGHWTGIEVHTPYIEQHHLNRKYDQIINADVRFADLPETDVCFAGDILEHLEKPDALELYERLLAHCKFVIFSIPIVHFHQEAEDGNEWQEHKADWGHDEILSNFESIKCWFKGKIVGCYVASRRHGLDLANHTFPRIAVYTIAKNERAFVDRMVTSALDADVILVADTGSTDGTYERLKELEQAHPGKVMAHQISVKPWRFDMARNAALSLLPEDIDLCISLDLDEVLAPGWRQMIDAEIKAWTTRVFFWFAWAKNLDGSDKVAFWGDKCHARFGYHWRYPVHEVIEPYGDTQEHVQYIRFGLDHYPDASKPRSQYLSLLELSCKESPTYGKNSLYLGREYFFYGRYREAIAELKRYLTLDEANWNPDRASAERYIAKAYMALGDAASAQVHFSNGVTEAPEMRETWGDLVQFFYDQQDWICCYQYARKFLKITARTDHYLYDPKYYGAFGYDMLSIAAWYLGKKDEALEAVQHAIEIEPNDQRLRDNLAFMMAQP